MDAFLTARWQGLIFASFVVVAGMAFAHLTILYVPYFT